MADDQGLSFQDMKDLQAIKAQLPADDPRHAKIDALVKSSMPAGGYGQEQPESDLSLYSKALFNPVGSGAHEQGLVGGAEQVGGKAMETMLSPIMHPIDTVTSGIHALAHPIDTAKGAVSGFEDEWKKDPALALENAGGSILGTVEGGRLAGGAAKEGIERVPTKAKAGKLFGEVNQATQGMPVNFTRTLPELEGAQRLSTWGHGNVTPLNSLYERLNTVNPVDFEEARGRYSPLTRLTANDKMSATPQLQKAASGVAHAMRADIGDTATAAGVGDQYEKGMNMWHQASRNAEVAKKVGKYAAGAGAGALGVGAGYHAAKNLLGW